MHKKVFLILTFIALAMGSLYAQSENDFEFPYINKKKIRLSKNKGEDVNEFTVHSEYDWKLRYDYGSTDWFEVSPTSGTKGTTTIQVKLISDNDPFNDYSRLRFCTMSIVNAEGATYFPFITTQVEQYSSQFNILKTIPDSCFKSYCKQFDSNQDGLLSISEAKKVEQIDISGLGIGSLEGIEYFESLRSLKCQSNSLTTLPCYDINQLEYLDCSDNQISGEVFLGPNMMLREVNCSNNQIEGLYLPMNLFLSTIDCKNNLLRSLKIDFIKNIQYLDCRNNNIDYINLSYANNLVEFDCSNNPVKYIYVKDIEYPRRIKHFEPNPQAIIYTNVQLRDEIEPQYELFEKYYHRVLEIISNFENDDSYNMEGINDNATIKLMILTDSLNQITGKKLSWQDVANKMEIMAPFHMAFNISLPHPSKVDNITRDELTEIVRRILTYKIGRYEGSVLQENYYHYTLGKDDYFMDFLRHNFKTFDEALFEKIETPTEDHFKFDENHIIERLWNKGNFR